MARKKTNRTTRVSKATPPPFTGRQELVAILLLLLFAALLRGIYLLQYRANVPYYRFPIVDSAYYDSWAMRVLEGKGYGPMPFYMAPLYPYVLAVTYAVFGHSVPTAYILQSMLGLASIFMVYLLGRRLFGHSSGLIAALLVTLYGPIVCLESKLLTETLAIALNLATLLALVYALEKPTILKYLGSGVLLGLSALCRPSTLIMAALVVGWLIVRKGVREKGSSRYVGALVLGIALAILPVTARNYFVGRDFAPITTNSGMVFAQGNHPLANGVSFPLPGFTHSIEMQQEQEIREVEKVLRRKVKPSESSAYWFRYGMRFIGSQPGKWVGLMGKKLIWSLHYREAACSYSLYFEKTLVPALNYMPLPIWAFTGLGLFGLVLSRRRNALESELLVLQILSVFLALMIFSVSSRYRIPAVPALAVFAGFGLVRLMGSIRRNSFGHAVWAAGCLLVLFLPSLVRYPMPKITAEAPVNAGVAYLLLGDTDNAVRYIKQAIALCPQFGYAHMKLGVALEKQGDLSQAEYHYAQAVQLEPDNAEARYYFGNTLMARGDTDKAIIQYEEALRVRPDLPDVHNNLGVALEGKGRIAEAVDHYRAAVRLDPDSARDHHNLGNALDTQGKTAEAMKEYREAIRLQPDLALSHNNLAVHLYLQGNYAEAWKEIHLCQKYGYYPDADLLAAVAKTMPDPGGP